MTEKKEYSRYFVARYAASKIIGITLGQSEATLKIETPDGSYAELLMTFEQFYGNKPLVGMYHVTGPDRHRIMTESQLHELSEEVQRDAI